MGAAPFAGHEYRDPRVLGRVWRSVRGEPRRGGDHVSGISQKAETDGDPARQGVRRAVRAAASEEGWGPAMRIAWLFALAASLGTSQELKQADGIPYEVRHVQGNVYMFASTLGNLAIQVGKDPGHDGVLLVDTGPARLRDAILAEIRK